MRQRSFMRSALLIPAVLATLFVAAACSDDDGSIEVPGVDGTAGSLDPSALLDDVEEVRTMLEDSASQFAPDVIADTQFEDDTLTVTMNEEVGGLSEAESLCEDLSNAVALSSVSIHVENSAGEELASCEFEG